MDKPAGPTSHDVVAAVRRATGMRRVGHAGTLDPFATGLLTVLVGRATRLAPFLVGLDKTYEGTLELGRTTDTDDATGTVVADAPVAVGDAQLRAAMGILTGTLAQIPPAFSAKKVAGRPAHRSARRGRPEHLAPVAVHVARFAFQGRDGNRVRFTADVGSGTYIRALARDLGAHLGCGAHLVTLRRTAVGPWPVTEAVSLADILEHGPQVLPAREAVRHLPIRVLNADEAVAVRHGRAVPDGDGDGPVALLADGTLLAVALREGHVLRPTVVLAA